MKVVKRSKAVLRESAAEVQQHCAQWHGGGIPSPGCLDRSEAETNHNFLFTYKVRGYHDDVSP